jgi:hypothetical protein
MASYRYPLGAYGRLVRYVWAIKTEVAIKVAVSLGVNAPYTPPGRFEGSGGADGF